MKLIPRIYQKKAVSAAVAALRNVKKALIVMATGLGKTVTSAWTVEKLGNKPGLFLVHNNDILERSMKEYRKVFPNLRFGLFNGSHKDFAGCDVVFASVQCMHRHLDRFGRRYFKWMVCDEGHHFHAPTFKKIVKYFQCPRLAITATPDRMDMQDIRELFGEEVVNISLELAIAQGWLPRIEYHLVTDDTLNETYLREIAEKVLKQKKKVSLEEIKRRLFINTREGKVVEIIEGYTEKTIVFCHNIPHTNHICGLLHGAATYHSDNKRPHNRKSLEDLQNGLVRRVCAVNSFNEGIDVPDVGLVVFLRSTQSEGVFRQQLGRGMRPGKEKLIVLDFAGNIERIRMIKRMVDTVARYHEELTSEAERTSEGYRHEPFVVSGQGFEFTFSQQVVDILKIFDELYQEKRHEFYPTWQEAATAAQKLGCKSARDYNARYKQDPLLPSRPNDAYSDFPGFDVFLGGGKYATWQEASVGAKKLGCKTWKDYLKKYKKDPKLSSIPRRTYRDFPGWKIFLGTDRFYPTWQEAGRAAKKLGCQTSHQYSKKYKSDPRLPCGPHKKYRNFPGWDRFFKGK